MRHARVWGVLPPAWRWALLAVPFAVLLMVGLLRVVIGPGPGLTPLLALGPASAAAIGGWEYTLGVGCAAMGEVALFGFALDPRTTASSLVVAFTAVGGVAVGGAVVAYIRRLRERELAEVAAVADATQRVLLRPVPERAGPLRLAARYISASTRARVGGDLYAVVTTAQGVRLIVGDVEGKGLEAVQEAATAMGSFRAACHQEATLAGVAARMEATLGRELGEEQFITAVLAEIGPGATTMELINFGHPQPLRLGADGPQFLGPEDGSLPLGLGIPGHNGHVPFTVPLAPGEPVLFYTDGLTEARNGAGEFFPLTGCGCLQGPADPPALLERLSAEVTRFVGHHPQDDIALLAVERVAPSGAEQQTAARSFGSEAVLDWQ